MQYCLEAQLAEAAADAARHACVLQEQLETDLVNARPVHITEYTDKLCARHHA